jgi:hypothetical protein
MTSATTDSRMAEAIVVRAAIMPFSQGSRGLTATGFRAKKSPSSMSAILIFAIATGSRSRRPGSAAAAPPYLSFWLRVQDENEFSAQPNRFSFFL